uniref:Metalloendopeptidase n=1 Tax=Magallana gigas TaxID=29159 RepID=A0A8W8NXR5_MAGGI|nr:blastula protease 10 isoform X1 [Crassostrea gigas]
MTHKISAALLGPSPVIYNRLSRILAQHLDVLHERNQMALYTATFFYLSVLLYLSQVVTADSDPQQDEGTLVRDLLTLLKRHQGSVHPLRRSESGGTETGAQGGDVPSEGKISDLTKESWERIKNPTKQLDTWNGDQNVPEADLMESFVVIDGDKKLKPAGLRPWDKSVVNAESNDVHVEGRESGNDATSKSLKKRNFAKDERLWEYGVVPYEIDPKITQPDMIATIKAGIDQMNKYTCLRILPRSQTTNMNLPHKQYLLFQPDSICISFIGRYEYLNSDAQPIGLSYPLCNQVQTILHELMHAIGMHHEQSRDDRDRYIKIFYDNIVGGTGNKNMNIYPTFDRYPYDAESVLQYGLYDLAMNGNQKTMELRDKLLEFLPAMTRNLSFYDVAEITKAYLCTDHCTSVPTCENGGFVHKGCECLCPKGLKGQRCEEADTDSGCGGIITLAAGESREITTPNYPNNYNRGAQCTWLIKGPEDKQIKMTILEFHVAFNQQRRFCYHWVEIRYNLIGQTGIRECGYHRPGSGVYVMTSSDAKGKLLLLFNSAFNANVAPTKGFKLKVEVV